MKSRRACIKTALTLVAAAGCAAVLAQAASSSTTLPAAEMPPPEPREFRAAWVATVANIDWPSAPGLSTEQQRREALALLDKAQAVGLNALVFQVRPAGDALYPSALEPWSEFLTGAQGRAPEPAWDPLAFWVREAHLRGLELHVWFNPYRARAAAAKTPLVAPHLGVVRPELVKRYGDQLWMDPGEPEAAAHTLAVVADVVRRYDVDGVHIDDYFYPYPVKVDGVEQPFPDDESYARYRLGGGALARDDWRRSHVDALVQQMQQTVQAIKPWVRFGVSPFGLGRPDRRPANQGVTGPGTSGFSQYDKLYADVERWFENGWLDYLAPQLYWQIDRPGLEFPQLLDYWIGQNSARRHLWPGLFTSLVTKGEAGTVLGPRAWLAREVLDQVQRVRARDGTAATPEVETTPTTPPAPNPGSSGHIHFSMVALMQDRDGIATLLKFGPYAQAALVPATPWLPAPLPTAPVLRVAPSLVATAAPRVAVDAGPAAQWLAVWRRMGGQWRLTVQPASPSMLDTAGADAVVVSGIARNGVAGPRSSLRLAAWTALPSPAPVAAQPAATP